MAAATVSNPTRPSLPPGHNPAAQRALVYSLTGMLVLTSWVIAAAFRDPCAAVPGGMPGVCHPTFSERLPSMTTIGTLLLIEVVMVVLYELRWFVRAGLTASVGVAQLAIAAMLVDAGKPTLLVLACVLSGAALLGLAYGVHKDNRAAWAFATVMCGVLTLIYFFASRRIERGAEIDLLYAVLPSLAYLLPITVALATSAPGAPHTKPFDYLIKAR